MASAPSIPSGPSSSSPPKSMPNWSAYAIPVITAPSAAAIDDTRMSRFLMWANSCASTPRTWSIGMCWSSPTVTASAACRWLRPVAKAFGCSDGMM